MITGRQARALTRQPEMRPTAQYVAPGMEDGDWENKAEWLSRAEAAQQSELAKAMLARRLANMPQIDNVFSGLAHLVNTYREKRDANRAEETNRTSRTQYRDDLRAALQSEDFLKAALAARSPDLQDLAMQMGMSRRMSEPTRAFGLGRPPPPQPPAMGAAGPLGFAMGQVPVPRSLLPGQPNMRRVADDKMDAVQTRQVQNDIMQARDSIAQLERVQALFDPRYQTLAGKMEQWGRAGAGRLGIDLGPEAAADYDQFRRYQTSALQFANQYIKNITGASMSETEAARIMSTLPDVGSGLFDWGDDPNAFRAKLEETIGALRSVTARRMYFLKNGITDVNEMERLMPAYSPDFPARMADVIRKRGGEIEAALRKQGLGDTEIKQRTRAMLKQEFGL